MYNQNSPIVQSMFGVPNGTSSFSEQNATQMANLSGFASTNYDYNPMTRFQNNYGQQMMMQQQQQYQQPQFSGFGMISSPITLGGQGYNSGLQSYNPGAVPQYGQGYGYSQPQQQCADMTYIVDGYNPSASNMMFGSDIQEKYNDIMNRMRQEQEEYQLRMQQNPHFNSYNYYGSMNNGQISPYIMEKYRKEEYKLEQEAVQRRIDFNKRLSRAAHAYLDDNISEEEIDSIYDRREVVVKGQDFVSSAAYNNLQTFTVDVAEMNRQIYIAHNNQVTEYHNSIVSKDANLLEYLDTAGELAALELQEEVVRQRRNKANIYNSGMQFRNNLIEQLRKRDGSVPQGLFPTLTSNSAILEDGTLQLKYPDYLKAKKDEGESSYNESKQKFINSIYNVL